MGNSNDKLMREAIYNKDLERIKNLLNEGFNLNKLYPELGLEYVGAPSLQWTYLTVESDVFNGKDNNYPLNYRGNIGQFPLNLFTGVDKISWTPLMYASCLGRKEIVEFFVQKGADISLRDAADQTALQIAKNMKRRDVIVFLENFQN